MRNVGKNEYVCAAVYKEHQEGAVFNNIFVLVHTPTLTVLLLEEQVV